VQILDILGELGGIQSVARELGISESQAASGAAAMAPPILGGFKTPAQARPLAMLVAGYVTKQHSATAPTQADGGTVSGGLGDVLGGMLGGGQRSAGGGTPGLASMLDLNGDGNPLDDILGMAGKLMR
jgi:hypothetical protein